MMREMLAPRRDNVSMTMTVKMGENPVDFAVTFGFDAGRRVREVFCLPFKTGTDMQALLHQAMIAISLGLQHGVTMPELARILGEDDPAPPRSIIGAIVRAGALLDMEGTMEAPA